MDSTPEQTELRQRCEEIIRELVLENFSIQVAAASALHGADADLAWQLHEMHQRTGRIIDKIGGLVAEQRRTGLTVA